MKFLLDENLSPRLVQRLADLDLFALHVVHIGRAGLSDPELFRYAYENDLIVVTINAGDFLTLAASCDLHPGIIVLRVAGLTAEEQWNHLRPVVRTLRKGHGGSTAVVNEIIEITGVEEFRRYPLPQR